MHLKQEILIFKSVIFFVVILFLISCGKKEVKKVSEESIIAREAFQIAENIKNAYLDNDRKALEKNSTKDGYRELIGAIKNFDSADLEFIPTWVEIEDSVVRLTISWKGTWIIRDISKDDRGVAVFVLEGQPLKLSHVLRANPFRQPE